MQMNADSEVLVEIVALTHRVNGGFPIVSFPSLGYLGLSAFICGF
jgi:hypothetical protein